LFKARQHGQIPKHTPRKVPQHSLKYEAPVPQKPPQQPPVVGQRSNQGPGFEIEERVMDLTKISPRPNHSEFAHKNVGHVPDHPQAPARPPLFHEGREEDKGRSHAHPNVGFVNDQKQGEKRLPLYLEGRNENPDRGHERRGQGQHDFEIDERVEREFERLKNERYHQRQSEPRGRDRERGQDRERGRDRERQNDRHEGHRYDSHEHHAGDDGKYRPHYEKRLSTPLEVRRSRSLSPPLQRRRFHSPEEILDEQRHMLEVLKQVNQRR
jgi:hypothetical protein